MSTSSESSQLTEQQPPTQHFTLVADEAGDLSIGLQKLHIDSFSSLQWWHDGVMLVKATNPNLKKDGDDDDDDDSDSSSSNDDADSDESDDDNNNKNKNSIKSNNNKSVDFNKDSDKYRVEHDITADNNKHLKSTKLIITKAKQDDVGTYECQFILEGRSIKRQIRLTEEVLERLIKNRGSVLNKKIKEKQRKSGENNPAPMTFQLDIPTLNLHESEEEDDDVVMDLPRISSRIFSRAPSVEEDDVRTGLSSALLQVQKGMNKRFRRDSDSSDTTEQNDINDENDDPGIVIMKGRSRRMSSIDISKSAQQRLLKLSNSNQSPFLKSPDDDSTSSVSDMDLFRQKLMSLPQKSRRISLAEIIPDWPRLEKPSLEHNSSNGSTVNKLGLPQIKVNLEGLEMSQVERRKSFSVRSRRTSLAEVIPDWPQLQKPKDKVENFLDELEDVVASEKDLRIELSCRFSKPNCKINWFKDNSEIFPGQKYNFLQDDNGIIRLIIQRLGVTDTGVYSCLVNEKHESKATLTVEEKKVKYTFIRKMPFSIKAQERKALQLECVLNDARGVVTWNRDDDDDLEYTPGLYEISRRDQRCILRIPEVGKELEGAKFECSVYGDNAICHVTVEEPEFDFVRRITDQDSYQKETAIFECEMNYEGAPVKWLKNGKAIENSDERYQKKVKGVVHRLVIKKVEGSDQAVYSCEVQKKSSSARLFVSPDLVILERLSAQSVLEHENITLRAKVRNPKNIPVQWMKKDVLLDPSSDRRVKIEVDSSNEEHTLSIRNACMEDAGQYMCKWETRVSEADVVVRECRLPPSVEMDHIPKEIMVKSGKRIKISIPYLGTPNPIARWRKDGKWMESDEHTKLNQYNGKCVMMIDSSERSDEGVYFMSLTNDCGETNAEIKIQVIGPPSAPLAPLEAMDIFKNKCHLRWNKPNDDGGLNIDKYVVEVFDATEGEVVSRKNVKGDTQCSVDGLIEGHRYSFKVKACNAEGESDWLCFKNEIVAKDPWVPPSRPGKPKIKTREQEMVEIEWKPSENDGGAPIQKYVLERRNTNNGEWQTVGMVPPTELCAIIPDLREAQQYEFRVVAVNKVGRGEWSEKSDKIERKTKKGKEPDFETPLMNTYTKEGTEVRMKTKIVSDPWPKIEWYLNDNLISDKDKFQILSDERSGELELVIRNAQLEDAGLIMCGVTNTFGNATSYAQLKFLAKPSFKQNEVLIEMMQGDKHKRHIQFSNSGTVSSHISIQHLHDNHDDDDDDDNKSDDNDVEISVNEDNNYLIFHVLRANHQMNKKVYTVELSNSVGTDKCTVKVQVTGCPGRCQGPLKVSGITRNSCSLSWKAPKVDGGGKISHYEVMKKDQSKGYWSSASNNTKSLSVSVENLVEGKRYFFKVAAVNQYGWGKFLESDEAIMARLQFDTPRAPGTPETSEATFNSVKLFWKPSPTVESPNNLTETPTSTYLIEKFFENNKLSNSVLDDHGWMNAIVRDMYVSSSPVEWCSCVVEGLVEGRKYCFRVVAENQAGRGGVSAASEWVTFTDSIAPPTFLRALDSEVEGLMGGDAELRVQVAGCPKPSVAWYKDDQVLTSNDKYDVGDGDDDDGSGCYRLVVKGVGKEDADEYMVKATNSQGSKSCRCHLVVLAPPCLQVTSMYQVPLVKDRGSEAVVKLYYTAHPPPSLTWRKKGVVLSSLEVPSEEEKFNMDNYHDSSNILSNYRFRRHSVSSKLMHLISDFGSLALPVEVPPFSQRSSFEFTPRFLTMKIWNVQSTDNGEYEVEVKNKYGADKATICIRVNDVPEAPTNLTSTRLNDAEYTLSWQEPEQDGGSIVTSYYVEILHDQLGDKRWMPYVLSRFTKANAENLLLGKAYHFRVGACNVFGKGPPSKSIRIDAGKPGCSSGSEHNVISRSISHSESRPSSSSSSSSFPTHQPFSKRLSRTSADRY